MKLFAKIILFNILITTVINAQGFGSYGSLDAKNIGLAGTNAISARGVYALGVNPANLVVKQDHNIELWTVLPLPTLNFTVGNDFMTLNDYNYFFTGEQGTNGNIIGKYLNAADKNKFLGLFDNGSMINTNVGISLLSFSFYPSKEIGAFGFSIQDWTSAQVSLPKQLFELVLFGNEVNKTFELNDLDFKSWYLRNYSLSYSRDLSKFFPDAFRFISAGISVKLVQGFFYAGVDNINTTLQTNSDYNIIVNGDSRMLAAASPSFGIEYDFEKNLNGDSLSTDKKTSNIGLFNKPAGTGFGVDFGIYAELNKVWSIGFAVTDLGKINWNTDPVEYSSNGSYMLENVTDENLLDSLANAITGEGRFTESFSTSLATAMKIGVGFKIDRFLKGKFPGQMLIELNYHQGFNNMPSNSTRERFSLGVEWLPINWFKFRTGMSLGGYDGFNWAMGLGFDSGLIDFDFAASYVHSLLNGNNAKRLGFAMSTRWTF